MDKEKLRHIPKLERQVCKQPDVVSHRGAQYFHQNHYKRLMDIIEKLEKELGK